jgi:hypothetical protein
MALDLVLQHVFTDTQSTNILVMAPHPLQPSPVRSVTFLTSDTAFPLAGIKAFQAGHRYSVIVASEGWLTGEGWMVRYGVPWVHALHARLNPVGRFYLHVPPNDNAWDRHDDRRFAAVGLVRRARPTRYVWGWVLCLHVREQLKFTTIPIHGDGNCQFRTVAVALFGDEEKHAIVRADVVSHLLNHPLSVEWLRALGVIYAQSWNAYCNAMSRDKEWGDDISLGAAARHYNVAFVIQNVTTNTQFLLAGVMDRSTRLVYLEYKQDAHYNLREWTLTPTSHKRLRDC